MIIDTHTHVFKKVPYLGEIDREYSPELLIALMDHAGVDKTILIGYDLKDIIWIANLIGQVERRIVTKEYCVKGFKKFPDRFIWFTHGFDPENKDYLDVVKKDVAQGASGIKLFPSITGFGLEDPRLEPLFEYCKEKDLRIIISHEFWNNLSRPPYTNEYEKYKKIVSNLITGYKEIKWLFCHLGCFNWSAIPGTYFARVDEVYKNIDGFIELMSYPNVWTDIAAISLCYDEPYPFPTAQKLIKRLVEEIGIEKFMFGSDWPWNENYCTYKQTVDMIRFADFLTNDQKEKFLGLNAVKFLNLKQ